MSSDRDLSPEEKLLKVIQQNKDEAPTIAPVTEPEPAPPAQKKLKLATAPAAPAVPPRKEETRAEAGPKPSPGAPPAARAAAAEAGGEAATAAAATPSPAPAPAGGGSRAFIASLRRIHGAAGLTLDTVIRFLAAIILVVFVLVVYDAFLVKPEAVPSAGAAGTDEVVPKVPDGALEPMMPMDQYLAQFSKRNVFQPGAAGGPATGAGGASSKAQEELKDYKLLGVSWDPVEEAGSEAIIRDGKKKMTYFVKEGQKIGESGIVVGKVQRDKVIVKQDGKETELR